VGAAWFAGHELGPRLLILDEETCLRRIDDAGHGVLSTLYAATEPPVRAIDSVPVVFCVYDRRILIPVDTIKPKRTTALGRLANVEADPRCTLLVDHYADDWDQLWWVRVHATATVVRDSVSEQHLEALAARYPRYRAVGTVVALMVLEPMIVSGWQAGDGTPRRA
jgi:PPOX class probable F420-dependent enzyme